MIDIAIRKKQKYKYFNFIFVTVLIFCILYIYHHLNLNEISPNLFVEEEKENIEKLQEEQYNQCINKKFQSNELSEDLLLLEKEIDDFIIQNQYQVSIFFEDISTGFFYSYKPNKIYYGCSLIKLVDALYLINKAIAGEIDLDKETVTYTNEYIYPFSSEMAKRKIGEEITLRELITYAIRVSDNSAHQMLIDYIGFSNLKSFGEGLGAKVILTGGDNFGNQTVEDTNLYLKEAYRIIKENEEYGFFLKSIMDNNERNAFNTNEIHIYHKYGSYADNFHDIGLNLENYPYSISIFTLHENNSYKQIIQSLHNKLRNLQNIFYKNRQEKCQQEIKGK